MVNLYHRLSRSIRLGDLPLLIHSLSQITSYFFAFNHPNYARWAVRFHDNLLKLQDSHPTIYEEFCKGVFSLRRTGKSFSRTPIDLALEQTINADAASQKTGLQYITNSIAARQRWAESHFLRMKVISQIFDDLGMTSKDDVASDLRGGQMKKNSEALSLIIAHVENTMNPFANDVDKDHLYNVGSGKCASKETKDSLLHVHENGTKLKEAFTSKCIKDPNRFVKKITLRKLLTFASKGQKYKMKANEKLAVVKMKRDLFVSILFMSLQHQIYVGELFEFPLTPVPLSLCHVDGTRLKTQKCA